MRRNKKDLPDQEKSKRYPQKISQREKMNAESYLIELKKEQKNKMRYW